MPRYSRAQRFRVGSRFSKAERSSQARRFNNAEIPRIIQRMMEDSGMGFIGRQDVQKALELLAVARVGIKDEREPHCLLASGIRSKSGGPEREPWPDECGKDASADVHSMTENGVLSKISVNGKGGREVLQPMLDMHNLVNLAKGDAGYPGSQGLWEIDRVYPRRVPISLAGVSHSTCADDDGNFFGMVDRLNLTGVTDYQRIADRHHPLEETLFRLGNRTLLFRMSQMRGIEREIMRERDKQVVAHNRFAVDVIDASLQEISGLVRELYRDKLVYDQRVVGIRQNGFVHHIMSFNPSVRFAASEYVDLPCNCQSSTYLTDNFLVSINVLPGDDRSWIIVTYPNSRCERDRYNSTIASWVKDFCAANDVGKRRHLAAMASWVNLYCSPEDYDQLSEDDRSAVEGHIARFVCRDPFGRFLDTLGRSSYGAKKLEEWRRE